MPVASAPAAFSVIEKQMRFSPLSRGFRNFSFWYSVPCSRIVSIEASSGPCVFIDSAPSMLSPSSICTSALASGPSPMPPYSFGTNGHHSPCARAFRAQFAEHLVERLGIQFLLGRDAFVVHPFADFRADRLGFGRDFEIDRHDVSSVLVCCWSGLPNGIYPPRASGNGKQSFKSSRRKYARSRRPLSRLRLRMDQHQFGAYFRARRRQGATPAIAARL